MGMDSKKLVYQFKVSLKGVKPAVWRRIEVPASYSFWDLHVAIQDSIGWLDYHLHKFSVLNPETEIIEEIGIPDDDPFEDDPVCLPGWELPISDYFKRPCGRANYEYDFGDGWEHEIILERIIPREPRIKYPKCTGGERACPPEDCGGIGGYEDMLEILGDPSHEEHESMMEWIGGKYDPDAFEPKKVRFDNPGKRWKIAFTNES